MMRLLGIVAVLGALIAPAGAQQVQQSGTVTPGHLPVWVTNGVIKDAGTATTPNGITGIGVTNNGGPGICIITAPITSVSAQQMCFSVNSTGGVISTQKYGSAQPSGLSFIIDGISAGFPLVIAPHTTGSFACFANSSGNLTNCASQPGTSIPQVPIEAFSGSCSNVDNTAQLLAAANSVSGAVRVTFNYPCTYNFNQANAITFNKGVILEGTSLWATILRYTPTADGTFLKWSDGVNELFGGGVNNLGVVSGDHTYAKTIFELDDVSVYAMRDVTCGYVGGQTITGGASGSQCLFTRGRDLSVFDNLAFSADMPIHIGLNQHNAGSADHWHFSNLNLIGPTAGFSCITVDPGVTWSDTTFDGFNAWQKCLHGIYQPGGEGADTVVSVVTPGTGYTPGVPFTVTGGGGTCSANVQIMPLTVNGSGGVLTAGIANGGICSVVPTTTVTATAGGAQLIVELFAGYRLSISNVRSEQALDPNGWTFWITPSATQQGLTINNTLMDTARCGAKFHNVIYGSVQDSNYPYISGACSTAIDATAANGNDFLTISSSYWNSATALLSGMNLLSGSAPAPGSTVPSNAEYSSSVTTKNFTNILAESVVIGNPNVLRGQLAFFNPTNSNELVFQAGNTAALNIYTFPDNYAAGATGYALSDNGAGTLTWAPLSGGNLTLTANSTKTSGFSAGQVLYSDGTLLQHSGSTYPTGSVAQGSVLNATSAGVIGATITPTLGVQQTSQGALILANTAAGAFSTTIQSSNSASAAWAMTLPTTAGASNNVLTTNGSGVTAWTALSSIGVSTFSAGTTGLTPSSATSGAITLAGTLAVANGGTNCSAASVTCFNNITGYTAAGATGTTSTNLVFSGSPTIASPTITGAFTATGLVTNADLVNAATTVNGQTCTLGSACTVTATATSALTIGTHLTGTSYNGSAPITIATDAVSTNTNSTIVARDSSGNFSAGTITASLTGHASLDCALAGCTMGGNIAMGGNAITGGGAITGTVLTSTIATGTAPLTVTSTTNVANLNASSLGGATFAAPGAIGSGIASTGAFTTLNASTSSTAPFFNATGVSGYEISGNVILNISSTYTNLNASNAGSGILLGTAGDTYINTSSFNLRSVGGTIQSVWSAGALSLNTTSAGTGTALNTTGTVYMTSLSTDAGFTDNTLCHNTSTNQIGTGTGALGICLGTSGRQFKTAIMPMQAGIDDLMKIAFVNYHYKLGYGDSGNNMQYGTTAQDVEAAIPDIARHDANGDTINYDSGALLFVGLRAIQQLKADNDNLRACQRNWKCRIFGIGG